MRPAGEDEASRDEWDDELWNNGDDIPWDTSELTWGPTAQIATPPRDSPGDDELMSEEPDDHNCGVSYSLNGSSDTADDNNETEDLKGADRPATRPNILNRIYTMLCDVIKGQPVEVPFDWTPEESMTIVNDMWILTRNDNLVRGFFDEDLARSRMVEFAHALCISLQVASGLGHRVEATGPNAMSIKSIVRSIVPVLRTEEVLRIVNIALEVPNYN